MSPRGSQHGGQSGSRDPPRTSQGNFSGGPPEDSNEFFFAPGGLRERFGNLPGRLLEPTWRPRGPRRPPGAILAPFLEPKWSPEASFFKLFWTPWGYILVTCALCSLRPRVYVAAGCLLGDVSLLFLSALCSPLASKVVPKMEPRDLISSILAFFRWPSFQQFWPGGMREAIK